MSQSDTTTAPRTEMTPEEKGKLLLDRLKSAFDNTPFVRVIGLELTHASTDVVTARFDMKPELVGNTIKQILHGGVIATALDMVGGMMGLVAIYPRMKEDGVPREERYLRLTRLGTIDMRVDYLAPGRAL